MSDTEKKKFQIQMHVEIQDHIIVFLLGQYDTLIQAQNAVSGMARHSPNNPIPHADQLVSIAYIITTDHAAPDGMGTYNVTKPVRH